MTSRTARGLTPVAPEEVAMSHLLEWSRAYTHRLNPVDAAPFAARAPELAQRLAEETAAGRLPF